MKSAEYAQIRYVQAKLKEARGPLDLTYEEAMNRRNNDILYHKLGRVMYRVASCTTQINSDGDYYFMDRAQSLASNPFVFERYIEEAARKRLVGKTKDSRKVPEECEILRGFALEAISQGDVDNAIDVLARSNGIDGFDTITLRAFGELTQGDIDIEKEIAEKITRALGS